MMTLFQVASVLMISMKSWMLPGRPEVNGMTSVYAYVSHQTPLMYFKVNIETLKHVSEKC